jgi:hypothetical protein
MMLGVGDRGQKWMGGGIIEVDGVRGKARKQSKFLLPSALWLLYFLYCISNN